MDWLQAVDFWHWWVLAVVLLILEVFSPGAFFLWMAIAAGIVGLLVLLSPGMFWEYQVLVFAVMSVASIVFWRMYFKQQPLESDHPSLNRRAEQYVGRVFTLQEPVVNGNGKIRVDDSTWKILGNDCPAGTRVRVTGSEGVILRVEVAD
jgi:membrane protein implicated in regulation of membrane protease activity